MDPIFRARSAVVHTFRNCKMSRISAFIRSPRRSWRRKFVIFGGLILATLIFLHFKLLPKLNGAYNKPCYLKNEQLEDLGFMVTNIITLYEEMNVTYWLDFGTLLGAVRTGDIIKHDGDADISRIVPEGSRYSLKRFRETLLEKGIESNSIIVTYKGLTVDLHLWKAYDGEYNGKPQKMVRRYFSKRIREEMTFIDHMYAESVKFPLSWILPPKRIDYIDIKARIPNDYDSMLKTRYPFTYFKSFTLSVPYKWKCWIPFLA